MPQQGQYSRADIDTPKAFEADLAAVRGARSPDSFESDLAAIRKARYLSTDPNAGEPVYLSTDPNAGEPGQGQYAAGEIDAPPDENRVLALLTKLGHIPGVTVAPESVRSGARRLADRATTPTLDDPKIPLPILGIPVRASTIKGFGAGALEGAAEFANLLDVLSFGRRSGALRGANALLAARGVGNVAEGVSDGSAAQGARGVAETALGAVGTRGPRPRPGAPVGAPRAAGSAAPPSTPNQPAQPTSLLDQLLSTLRTRAVPPPPPIAAPTVTDPVEEAITILRRATAAQQAPTRGFAEPPIVPRPVAGPVRVPNIVEPVIGTGMAGASKPHDPADDVLEFLRQRERVAAAQTAPATAADVVIDSRLAATPQEELTNRIADLRSAAAKGRATFERTGQVRARDAAVANERVANELEHAATARGGFAAQPIAGPEFANTVNRSDVDRLANAPAALDAALLRGRQAFDAQIPKGTAIPDEIVKDLDLKGIAYRDADRAFMDAQRQFTAGEIDAAALQTAKLTRRQAGKVVRQTELKHRDFLNKPLPRDAGVIAPDVARWLGSTTAGATAGAAADDEHPLRGAIVGGLLGAAVPGTVAGIRSEGGRAVVKAYVSGLLSGPPTHVRNITSTTLNGLFRYASHPAAVGADLARSTATNTPREKFIGEIVPGVVATLTGLKRGTLDAVRVISQGTSPYSAIQGAGTLQKYELPGGLTNPMNWPGRALLALDTLLGRTVESQALAELAYARARKSGHTGLAAWRVAGHLQASPPADLLQAAEREGNRALFRDLGEGWTKRVVNTVEHVRDEHPVIGGLMVPFVRVPAAIFRQMIELTPAGLVLRDTMNTREQMERLGRMFTGSLILYQGANMLWEGRASGSGPTNPSERAKLHETGWRPYAINVPLPDALGQKLGGSKSDDGTYWVSNNALGPVGLLFSAAADVAEGWKDAGAKDDSTLEQQIFAALARLGYVTMDQTFLTDAVDLGEALNNPSLAQRYFHRKAQSAVPFSSMLRTITRATDTTVRQPETLSETIQTIIPGQSESVPSRLSRFGEDIQRPMPEGAGAYVLPPISPVRRDPILDLLSRTGAAMGKPTGRLSVGDFTPPLSRDEERALVRSRGQLNKQTLELLRRSEIFRALAPDAQKQVIEITKARVVQQRRTGEILDLLRQHPEWGQDVKRELERRR